MRALGVVVAAERVEGVRTGRDRVMSTVDVAKTTMRGRSVLGRFADVDHDVGGRVRRRPAVSGSEKPAS